MANLQFCFGRKRGKINVTKSTAFSSFHNPNDYCKDIFPEWSEINNTFEVDVRRLDRVMADILEDIPGKSFFLKTDTQGFDINVFNGAKNFIKSIKGLVKLLFNKRIVWLM